jgi:hypothetical protein
MFLELRDILRGGELCPPDHPSWTSESSANPFNTATLGGALPGGKGKEYQKKIDTKIATSIIDSLKVGSGRYCMPRYGMPFIFIPARAHMCVDDTGLADIARHVIGCHLA